jgi:transcriptional regulator with GAF, ATPase, and Fis domain
MTQAAMRAADEASLNPRRTLTVSIRLDHLPSHLRDPSASPVRATSGAEAAPSAAFNGYAFPTSLFDLPRKQAKDAVVQEFEVRYVTHLLEKNDYNVTHAAREADMQRPNFKRLMNRLDIQVPRGPQ